MLLSLLPVNILMCVWLFSFKCCGEENAAAAYGASDFQVAGFHRTRSPKKKSLVTVGKVGKLCPIRMLPEANPAPRAPALCFQGLWGLFWAGHWREGSSPLSWLTHPLWAPFLLHGGLGGSVQTMGCRSQERLCTRFQISWQALSSPSWGVLSWIQMYRGNGPSGNGPSDFTAGAENLSVPLSILQPLCIQAILLNDVLCTLQTERRAVATTECQDLAVGNGKNPLVLGTAGSFPSNKPVTRFLSFQGRHSAVLCPSSSSWSSASLTWCAGAEALKGAWLC